MAFKRIFPQERFTLLDFTKLAASNIFNDLWRSAREGSIRQHFSSILWFRWMQFWGTHQGYRQSGTLTWELRKTFYYPQGTISAGGSAKRDIEPIDYYNEP